MSNLFDHWQRDEDDGKWTFSCPPFPPVQDRIILGKQDDGMWMYTEGRRPDEFFRNEHDQFTVPTP